MFDCSLRGANAASRGLGIGHPLFDIALDDAHDVPVRVASVDGLSGPLLIIAVEDEVTGTGSLVHRLIFGVAEKEAKIEVLRDWELLQATNALTLKSPLGPYLRLVLKRRSNASNRHLTPIFLPMRPRSDGQSHGRKCSSFRAQQSSAAGYGCGCSMHSCLGSEHSLRDPDGSTSNCLF